MELKGKECRRSSVADRLPKPADRTSAFESQIYDMCFTRDIGAG